MNANPAPKTAAIVVGTYEFPQAVYKGLMPHLQKALVEKATIDLKPFATSTQKKIATVISDFQKNEDGVRVAADITSLRLADLAFDSKTLRVIAEAQGAVTVSISSLPGR